MHFVVVVVAKMLKFLLPQMGVTRQKFGNDPDDLQGVFFHWYPPKKLKYRKPRLGESTLT